MHEYAFKRQHMSYTIKTYMFGKTDDGDGTLDFNEGKKRKKLAEIHPSKMDMGSNSNGDPIAVSVRNYMPETLPNTLENLGT